MPQHYDFLPNATNNNDNSNPSNNLKHTTPSSEHYFHRAPLISPRFHQQHTQNIPTRLSSPCLGPLHHNRPRFLSAWNLTPRPVMYNSSRNIATNTPVSTAMSKPNVEGSSILNSCAFL
ncbi:unnamed protein product [Rotaria magnacalcarata]|nr:unnamed protein product [Rotaria magnacalcarata]